MSESLLPGTFHLFPPPLHPSSIDPAVFPKNSCRKISIVYGQNSYECCLSNRTIYVWKKKCQETLVDV